MQDILGRLRGQALLRGQGPQVVGIVALEGVEAGTGLYREVRLERQQRRAINPHADLLRGQQHAMMEFVHMPLHGLPLALLDQIPHDAEAAPVGLDAVQRAVLRGLRVTQMLPRAVGAVERRGEPQTAREIRLEHMPAPHQVQTRGLLLRPQHPRVDQPWDVIGLVPVPLLGLGQQALQQVDVRPLEGHREAFLGGAGEVDAEDGVGLVIDGDQVFVAPRRVRRLNVDRDWEGGRILPDRRQRLRHPGFEPRHRGIEDEAHRIRRPAVLRDLLRAPEVPEHGPDQIVRAALEVTRMVRRDDVLAGRQPRHGPVEVLNPDILSPGQP